MLRIPIEERPHWRELALEHGFKFHGPKEDPYWDERAYYSFTLKQIEQIERAAEALHKLCLEAVSEVVESEFWLRRFQIPESHWAFVRQSWQRRDPHLYGRMDFAFDGQNPPKLLEYNADTPTCLYETAVWQWLWLEEQVDRGKLPPTSDQFNAVHEKLIIRLAEIVPPDTWLHLSCCKESDEDYATVQYLKECAELSRRATKFIFVEDIGISVDGRFTDLEDWPIRWLFKLYPWEEMLRDPFARYLPLTRVHFLEPPWKAILSNKALLPFLWRKHRGHPNLLPAYFEEDPAKPDLGFDYVRKPIFSREGCNVEIYRRGRKVFATAGPYGEEGHILQQLAPLPQFGGQWPVFGVWLIGDEAVGMMVREENRPITTDDARLLPHLIFEI